MAEEGSAEYQRQMAEIDAEKAAWEKKHKIISLKFERETYYRDDPNMQAEIDREIAEIRDSN
jgi:hypothetical protein